MPDELMRGFLVQTIECVDAFSDALNYILHHYEVTVNEKKEFYTGNFPAAGSACCFRTRAQGSSFCCRCPCTTVLSASSMSVSPELSSFTAPSASPVENESLT